MRRPDLGCSAIEWHGCVEKTGIQISEVKVRVLITITGETT
jgi:hypothetical protein